ncbi:MFS transporter [Shewanella sp. Choline-02u-19]|uniref:DUF2955 domain-containing protein n=1 Tax=unclassified Shewanella TaxID=196818 RepID=UPI000C345015|nr:MULTISPECIES: DUF2955 domain-containing protein [unclassified Shewanella]PKG76669.1 MFS transporter [Shewanella sp. GutCb]PKH54574.1 MFS transporter [Shewanella sp. Bg11-22]PKI28632.1 MFS transporter [Shewanella sp. Choline-02u-19]
MKVDTLRKTQRIWFGSVTGLAVTLVFGWWYGLFAALLPMFVLTKIDRWNSGIIMQLIISVVWICIQVTLIVGFLQPYPLLMTLAVGLMLMFKCIAMTHKSTYLFGYIGLLIGSILLNFASYNGFDLEEFVMGLIASTLVTAPIVGLAFYLFPEQNILPASAFTAEPTAAKSRAHVDTQRKDHNGLVRQALLGWLIAMAAFILFQVADLNDSLSAQASIFIVLTPMTLIGSLAVAKIRIIGTFLGCFAGMLIQLTLYTWSNNALLFLLAYAIAAGIFCRWLALGDIKAGIGFSAMSALTVPLTTSFVPEQKDAFFSICYRFSSILMAVVCTSLAIWITHHFLVRIIKAKPLKKATDNGTLRSGITERCADG